MFEQKKKFVQRETKRCSKLFRFLQIFHFVNQISELILKILASPLESLCTLHEIDTVLKLIYTLESSTDANIRLLDGQIQRFRPATFKLLPMFSRDDLFRYFLSRIDTTEGREIVSSAYWRVCSYILAMSVRLIHQSKRKKRTNVEKFLKF